MLKVYGSPLCPECVACKSALDNNQVEFEYINITESMRNLKEFLKIRDNSEEYKEVKEGGYVGIPTLIDDGKIILDYEEWLQNHGYSLTAKPTSGAACNIDGSGC